MHRSQINHLKKLEQLKVTIEKKNLLDNYKIARGLQAKWDARRTELMVEKVRNPNHTCQYGLLIEQMQKITDKLQVKSDEVTAIREIAHNCMTAAPKIAVIFLQRTLEKMNSILSKMNDNVHLKKAVLDINGVLQSVYDIDQNLSAEWVRDSYINDVDRSCV